MNHISPLSIDRRGWQLDVFPQWRATFRTIEQVVTLLTHPAQILQDNSRGVVSVLHHQNLTFVAKWSKIQAQNRWAQLTSLYRKGEGTRMLSTMAAMAAAGLPVPEPVLILERKRYGFTLASWTLYRYLEGRPCSCADAPRIAELLKQIHAKGWVHRDPHVTNFLRHGDQLAILDCARARPWTSRYARMYDVVLLDKCCPGSKVYYGISETDRIYHLAKLHNTLIQRWRRIKRRIRSTFNFDT